MRFRKKSNVVGIWSGALIFRMECSLRCVDSILTGCGLEFAFAVPRCWCNNPLMLARVFHILSRPVIFFYAVPWLMVLLVAGTLAQRQDGLYRAEQMYFSSMVLWLRPWGVPVPLPGGMLVLLLIAMNLAVKLLRQQGWRGKIGNTLTHVSMLVLLLGGAVTAWTREEGFMELAPAATSAVVQDYHRRELVIRRDNAPLQTLDFAELHVGQQVPQLPFALTITSLYRHCALLPADRAAGTTERRGAAQQWRLLPQPELAQDEDNNVGLGFTLAGAAVAQNGHYILSTALAEPVILQHGGARYELVVRRAQRQLPFQVRLEKFYQDIYPGTQVPRAYQSDVSVQDGGVVWQASISMNAPLRYRGYTLYQAAFVEQRGTTSTVLTVVKDGGAWFPYLAIALACLGMLVHLLGRRRLAAKAPA
jgi:hypothetical protein